MAQAVEPTTKSHAPVEEHDERRTVGQVRDHPSAQLVVQAATYAATDTCWNVNRNVLNWGSRHQAVYVNSTPHTSLFSRVCAHS